jgi:hypothetical protein
MMSSKLQDAPFLYPAVFSPVNREKGHWRVRFPDLGKEDRITGGTLQEVILKASTLLKQHLSTLDRSQCNIPSPKPYEDVIAEQGETVQLILVCRNLPEKTRKGGFFFRIVFCCIAFFLFWSLIVVSSPSCPGPAEASNIISELRNLKAAAMMYKADHLDTFSSLSENENHLALLFPYFDNLEKYSSPADYRFALRVVSGVVWAGCNVGNATPELRKKLEMRAQSTGLFGSLSIDTPPASCDVGHRYASDAKAVWLFGQF